MPMLRASKAREVKKLNQKVEKTQQKKHEHKRYKQIQNVKCARVEAHFVFSYMLNS